jgi:membrane protease YdiL (CAAX protease family)
MLCFVDFAYFVLLPIVIIRFFRKQSVAGRLGLQPENFLGLALLILFLLLTVNFSGLNPNNAFFTVFAAPISEEIFFRGYMLGEFRNNETIQSYRAILYMFLISGAFALAHSFVVEAASVLYIFAISLLYSLFYWFLGSILLSVTLHSIYNFWVQTQTEQHASMFPWIFLMILPATAVFAFELMRKRVTKATLL